MRLNHSGECVAACWRAIPKHFELVRLDEFVVMPNHVHGILFIIDVEATHTSPLQAPTGASGPRRGSLSAIVGSFKSAASRQINELSRTAVGPVWQRNFYEHVIQGDAELTRIRQYIANNPVQWELDSDNPMSQKFLPRP